MKSILKFSTYILSYLIISISLVMAKDKSHDSKTINDFSATLFISNDSTIFDRWNQPSKGFDAKEVSKVGYGETFYPIIIFNNCKKGSMDVCRVSYNIKILKPNNKEYLNENLIAWNARPAHSGMEMSEKYLSIKFEKKDHPGKYKVIVNVIDENSGIKIPLKIFLKLIN